MGRKSIDAVGAIVGGRYRLSQLAGQGGMAEVWRAELQGPEGFSRPVAIKRILKHLVNSPDHRAMFVEEARLGAMLDHPNVVQVYDFGEDGSGLFIAMEWVEGLSMRELAHLCAVHKALPSPALAAAVGIEILRALEAAHENAKIEDDGTLRPVPIIHRDVSPSNVMLSVRGIVKLADFGLARAVHRSAMGGLTPAGVVKGKIAYLAPEVLQGKKATPVSDLYGCGVVLWETLAGRRMYAGKSDYDIVMDLVRGAKPPKVREVRADAPEGLARAVDKALEPDPAHRYQSAAEFARALADVLRTIPERTDTSRLSREIVNALALWRRMQTAQAARDKATGTEAPGSIDVEFSTSNATPLAPEDIELLPDAVLEPEEASALLAIPLVIKSEGAAPEKVRAGTKRE